MATYSSYKQITTVNIPDGGVTGADLEVNIALPGTDSVTVPKGTEAQRGTGVAGKFRFNTDAGTFEGYSGSEWGAVGGGAVDCRAGTRDQGLCTGRVLGDSCCLGWQGR